MHTELPRCADCGAALVRRDEPHTIEDCRDYREMNPVDQAAYEEAVEMIRAERNTTRLDFDHIPIERHWGVSILLHNALGHTEPWEICEAGCDRLASDAIRVLFGREIHNETTGAPGNAR